MKVWVGRTGQSELYTVYIEGRYDIWAFASERVVDIADTVGNEVWDSVASEAAIGNDAFHFLRLHRMAFFRK